jgi:hypothetical protein
MYSTDSSYMSCDSSFSLDTNQASRHSRQGASYSRNHASNNITGGESSSQSDFKISESFDRLG